MVEGGAKGAMEFNERECVVCMVDEVCDGLGVISESACDGSLHGYARAHVRTRTNTRLVAIRYNVYTCVILE